MIIRRPRVYIGEKCIFTYPFDYVARLGPREQSLLPYFAYDSNKGMGGGLKGYVDLGTVGELNVNAIYWSDDMWEARLHFRREVLFEGLSVFLESNRLYDSDSGRSCGVLSGGLSTTRRTDGGLCSTRPEGTDRD
jgi:LPS-assembly protein